MADGYVLIDTEINTAGISKGVSKLEKEIAKTTAAVEKQRSQLQGYFDELDRIHESTDAMLKLANTTEEVNRILEIEQGEVDTLNAKYEKQLSTLNQTEETLSGQKTELEMAKEAVLEQVEAQKRAADAAGENADAAGEVKDAYKDIPAEIDESNNKLNVMNNTLKSALTKIIRYGVGVGSALAMFNKMKSAAKQGLDMIAESDERAKAAIEALDASFNSIKQALGQAILPLVEAFAPIVEAFVPLIQALAPIVEAFVPILNALVPLVRTIVELVQALMPLIQALTPILQVIADILSGIVWAVRMLFGLSSNDRSYKGVQNLATHFSGVEASATGASAAIKEMQQNLSGLDEINTFEKQNASYGGGGGGIPSMTTPDLNIDAENVNVNGDDTYERGGVRGYRHSYDLTPQTNNPHGAIAQALREGDPAPLYDKDGKFLGYQMPNGILAVPKTKDGKWINPDAQKVADENPFSDDALNRFDYYLKNIPPSDKINKETYKYERDPVFGGTTDTKKEEYKTRAEKAAEEIEKSYYNKRKDEYLDLAEGEKTHFGGGGKFENDTHFGGGGKFGGSGEIPRAYGVEPKEINKVTKKADRTLNTFYNKVKDRTLNLGKDTEDASRGASESLDTFYNKTKTRFTQIEADAGKTSRGVKNAAERPFENDAMGEFADSVYGGVKAKFDGENNPAYYFGDKSTETLDAVENPYRGNKLGSYFSSVYQGVKDTVIGENDPSAVFGNKSEATVGKIKAPFENNTLGAFFGGTYDSVKKLVAGTNSPDVVFGSKAAAGVNAVKTNVNNGKLGSYFASVYKGVTDTVSGTNDPATVFGNKAKSAVPKVKAPYENNTLGKFFGGVYDEIKANFNGQNSPDVVFGNKFQGGADELTKPFENVPQKFGDIKNKIGDAFKGAWGSVTGAFPGNGTGVGQWFTDNVGYPIASTMRTYLNKIIKMINDQLKSLNYTRTGVSNNIGGAVAAIQLLQTIPAFATGAVIPPNAPFLGIMGDQRHGTNIETPEDLLRKIVREESGRGSYEFTAQINRRTLFDEIIDEGKLRKSATGYNPFEV